MKLVKICCSNISINPTNFIYIDSFNIYSYLIGSSSLSHYSIEVIAKDGGYPPKEDTTTVEISIDRNIHEPIWRVADTGSISILETQALSESINRVYNYRLSNVDQNSSNIFSS